MTKKIFVSTTPFCQQSSLPVELVQNCGHSIECNTLGRKMTEKELAEVIGEYDVLIAGTENIGNEALSSAGKLKHIARVGIGLDSVDLIGARERGVSVSYTPDAPAPAVAELTLGLMLSLLRHINQADINMRKGNWNRYFGRRIPEITIGVIGVGRIGSRVIRRLSSFGTPKLLVNDIDPKTFVTNDLKIEWASKEDIIENADLITIHTPLTQKTRNMIGANELSKMKSDALLINTARGGIVDEHALYNTLKAGHLAGAALDVFEKEPYDGPLKEIDRCILTSHMGSMSKDCRMRMEIEATSDALAALAGKPLQGPVPESEYEMQKEGLDRSASNDESNQQI